MASNKNKDEVLTAEDILSEAPKEEKKAPKAPKEDVAALKAELEALKAEKAERDAADAEKAKENDPSNPNRLVEVMLTRPSGIKDTCKYVGVNGKRWLIPYGESYKVPYYVAVVLQEEQAMMRARERVADAGVVAVNETAVPLNSFR